MLRGRQLPMHWPRTASRRPFRCAPLVLVMLAWASGAVGECRSSGRREFATALEALSAGDLATSARLLLDLIEQQPNCPEARNNLAVIFVEQERFADAAEQLREAIRQRPGYQLAQRNLERLDAVMQAQRAAHHVAEAPPPIVAGAPPTPASGGGAPPGPLAEGSHPALIEPTARVTSRPSQTADPTAGPTAPAERNVSTVSVIEPSHNRVCVHQRNSQGVTGEECYPIAAVEVSTWPRWLVATELTPQRIRLRDESGQLRLEIVREGVSVTGDALRLREEDFDALAQRIVPWRTAWVVLE
jgi:tetratricopeptide (TPR) repeat protein